MEEQKEQINGNDVGRDAKIEEILAETEPKETETAAAPADTVKAPETAAPEQKAEPEQKTEEEDETPEDESYNMKAFIFDMMDLIESVLVSVFVVMLIFTFVVCVANVEGDSMLPTLEDGNRLMVSRFTKHFDDGDILILNSTTSYMFDESGNLSEHPGLGKEIVKRLIAQGGQVVNIDFAAGIVYVDGQALDEPYTSTLTNRDHGAFTYPLTVPEGYVFVLGDNRHISRDSRHPDIGLVKEEDIIGKVLLRLSPLSEFGTVS